ncbi:alpha/beta hydrolase [Balneolaceae bacterium YR4-1]|uniref:Alpha/beta hydrolase n=1 Tax=Halalkalibaculum roseum TaxID=2709311 RepID=A0A6M1SSY4_9BACT|nr:alpha/beta hydrolase [Halalkalibaculum roseum]NGP75892.1 alpha/beta hydrolase [Halalkalibaculum roseum]
MFGSSKYPAYTNNGYKFLKISNQRSSRPPLVLLHGMFGGHSNFDPLVKRLDDQTIFVPLIPLYSLDKEELSIPMLSDWLHKFCRDCEIERPVLLGNSMGGHVALEYSRVFTDDVTGLVLAGSSGLFENDFGSTNPKRNDRNYIRKRAALTFYEDIVTEELVDEIMEVTQSPQKLPKLLKIARSTHKYNMESMLKDINLPVLLIWGKNDQVTPPRVAEQFFKKLPDVRLKWIEKCGHAPMMERPDEFVEHLKPFLQQLEYTKANKKNKQNYEGNYSHK